MTAPRARAGALRGTRLPAAAAVALLLLLLLLPSGGASGATAGVRERQLQSSSFPGTQGVLVSRSDDSWSLRTAAGAVFRLSAQPSDARGARVGSGASVAVNLACTAPDDDDDDSVVWECSALGAANVTAPAPAIVSTATTLNLLTIVTSFNGACAYKGANVTLVDQTITRVGGYADNLQACSYGQMRVNKTTSRTFGVVLNCTAALQACDEDALAAAATAAVQRRGVAVGAFTHHAFVLPEGLAPVCAWAASGGVAELPGRRSWLTPDARGVFSRGTHMKTLLHNFGVYTAWRANIRGDDASSSQGRGNACPSAPELWRLRWAVPVAGAVLAGAGLPVGAWRGAFELSATYLTSRNMIKIVPDWLGTAYTQNIYFALRGKGGGDRDLLAEFDRKVSYHAVNRALDQPLGTARGDPRVTLVGRLFPGTTSLLTPYRLVITVGVALSLAVTSRKPPALAFAFALLSPVALSLSLFPVALSSAAFSPFTPSPAAFSPFALSPAALSPLSFSLAVTSHVSPALAFAFALFSPVALSLPVTSRKPPALAVTFVLFSPVALSLSLSLSLSLFPVALSSAAFSPLTPSPAAVSPFTLPPAAFSPFTLSPAAFSPFALSPLSFSLAVTSHVSPALAFAFALFSPVALSLPVTSRKPPALAFAFALLSPVAISLSLFPVALSSAAFSPLTPSPAAFSPAALSPAALSPLSFSLAVTSHVSPALAFAFALFSPVALSLPVTSRKPPALAVTFALFSPVALSLSLSLFPVALSSAAFSPLTPSPAAVSPFTLPPAALSPLSFSLPVTSPSPSPVGSGDDD
ncbi:hypothetical protein HYH03_004491 [Edaphochlamys debaryana]|uniref:Peptidase M11 gametolysin domain-containing protein n=1 Tax=Edaphochlamys debaryana TaxID=47281 RepID=A0A835Y6P8_9CHLO|nr:hypothetical protein HYH03_004491 [Edaphochlamys debaryana]|eukprot:KAG2497327.1 hypothetical protein HYH03_004491 [Edaphochlamys debaryana]